MLTLNRYVHNRAYLEGSMIEAYTTEEAMNWCMKYLRDGKAIGPLVHWHKGRTLGVGHSGRKARTDVATEAVHKAHYSILHHLVTMEKIVDKHLEQIRTANDGQRTETWVQKQHKNSFVQWLKKQDITQGESDEVETVKKLVSGPSTQITMWQGYNVNGYTFHTKEKDKKSAAQNCGVRYVGIDESTGQRRSYFGQIEEIWELDYGGDL